MSSAKAFVFIAVVAGGAFLLNLGKDEREAEAASQIDEIDRLCILDLDRQHLPLSFGRHSILAPM